VVDVHPPPLTFAGDDHGSSELSVGAAADGHPPLQTTNHPFKTP